MVLAFLTLHWERPIARSWISAELWPDIPEADGRANLRRYVHLSARLLRNYARLYS